MGINVTGYTEARINGKWHCIDFHQYDSQGQLHLIPSIAGRSSVAGVLEDECSMDRILGAPEDLSEEVRRLNTATDGTLYGSGEQIWISWHIIEGEWFKKANLDFPEYCGFFTRQNISLYLGNPEENTLNPEEMLSAEEYQALDVEGKKAYQYYEYTEPYGNRAILRSFKQAVVDRIKAFNRYLSWQDGKQEITFDDVRILITFS